jgi:hypothetical protein
MKISEEIKISDNGFVFNPETGDSFNINSSGLELIRLLSQGKDFEVIKTIFLEKFEVDELTFEKDFYEFCSLLKNYQLTIQENPSDFS